MPIISETSTCYKNGKFCSKKIYCYVLPNGVYDNFIDALLGKTGEEYKELIKKEFAEWQKFKKDNENSKDFDTLEYAQTEKEIKDWLKSREILLPKELKELKSDQAERLNYALRKRRT